MPTEELLKSYRAYITTLMVAVTSRMGMPQAQGGFSVSSPTRTRLLSLQQKVSRPTTLLRAVNMHVDNVSPGIDTSQLVSETEFSLLTDLQLRFEDMWHDYAAARKRNMSLQIEKEALQTRLRNTTAALKQEQHNCRQAEEKAAELAARLEAEGKST